MRSLRSTVLAPLVLGAACSLASMAAAEPATSGDRAEVRTCEELGADAIAGRVQARYDGLRQLSARFVQTTQSVVLSMGAPPGEASADNVSSGRVYFAKPGRMRWEYLQPAESYVISDGKLLWIFDVDARQVTRLTVGEEVLAGAALQFLLGDGRLAEAFDITLLGCSPGRAELDLHPREPSSYERLGLEVELATGLAVSTSVSDLLGNRTQIRFERIAIDEPSPAGAFEFEPPPGVEVIDVRATD